MASSSLTLASLVEPTHRLVPKARCSSCELFNESAPGGGFLCDRRGEVPSSSQRTVCADHSDLAFEHGRESIGPVVELRAAGATAVIEPESRDVKTDILNLLDEAGLTSLDSLSF